MIRVFLKFITYIFNSKMSIFSSKVNILNSSYDIYPNGFPVLTKSFMDSVKLQNQAINQNLKNEKIYTVYIIIGCYVTIL